MIPRVLAALILITTLAATPGAQFRRGLFAETTEITLYPIQPPALLLPAGTVKVEVRNASGASARIVERLQERMVRQLGDNDSRLRVAGQNPAIVVTATVTEWNESRRNSTKYVSETRQVGTRQVVKDGKTKTEPVYEYGRNRPSVVISATAGVRIEVRPASGAPIADETARHAIREEYLLEAGPPSREEIEDQLIDRVVQKGAGRVSPGRQPVRVLLARSDDVDRLNELAQNRRWEDWRSALEKLAPHRDGKREAYRLHNLAVAHEALAYEATHVEDWTAKLARATTLIRQAAALNAKEKYIGEASERILLSVGDYSRLAELYKGLGLSSLGEPAAAAAMPKTETGPAPTSKSPVAMTNQDVIELRAAGLDDDNLIAAIKEARAVKFDLSPAGLKALLGAKISNKVIAVMRARAG